MNNKRKYEFLNVNVTQQNLYTREVDIYARLRTNKRRRNVGSHLVELVLKLLPSISFILKNIISDNCKCKGPTVFVFYRDTNSYIILDLYHSFIHIQETSHGCL